MLCWTSSKPLFVEFTSIAGIERGKLTRGFSQLCHFLNRAPERSFTMADLGVDDTDALCEFAVCTPFQLLSASAVAALRQELASEAVQASCKFSNARTPW